MYVLGWCYLQYAKGWIYNLVVERRNAILYARNLLNSLVPGGSGTEEGTAEDVSNAVEVLN